MKEHHNYLQLTDLNIINTKWKSCAKDKAPEAVFLVMCDVTLL
jgi:hypothetical protein